ncbi:uncharacterized protein [Centruroides vittatus]|uniref:uncharacterized protein n=1 Tax=Centruroides vittatus TaxID=120091 RepID=UPI0035109847
MMMIVPAGGGSSPSNSTTTSTSASTSTTSTTNHHHHHTTTTPSPTTTVRSTSSLPPTPNTFNTTAIIMSQKDNLTLSDPDLSSSVLEPVQLSNDTSDNQTSLINETNIVHLEANHTAMETILEIANTTSFVQPNLTTKRPHTTKSKNHTSVQYSISTYSVSSSDNSETRTYSFEPKRLKPQEESKIKMRDPGYIIFTALNPNISDVLRPVYKGSDDDSKVSEETQTSISVSVDNSDNTFSTPSPKTYVLIEDFQGEKLTRKATKKTNPSDKSQTQTSHESKKTVAGSLKNLRHSNYHITNYTYVADETTADRRMSTSDSDMKTSETEFLPLTDITFFNPFPAFNSDGDSSEDRGGYGGYSEDRPGQYYHASEAREKDYGVLGSGNFEVVKGGIYKEEEGSENNLRYHRANPEPYNNHGYQEDEAQYDFGSISVSIIQCTV